MSSCFASGSPLPARAKACAMNRPKFMRSSKGKPSYPAKRAPTASAPPSLLMVWSALKARLRSFAPERQPPCAHDAELAGGRADLALLRDLVLLGERIRRHVGR